jgi:uncharacterized protein YuzE
MIPDSEGYWWYKNLDNEWVPGRIRLIGRVLAFAGAPVADWPTDRWADRLYAPDEYPRYHRLTGEPVAYTEPEAAGRVNVDFDKDGCVVGLEVLHAEGGK